MSVSKYKFTVYYKDMPSVSYVEIDDFKNGTFDGRCKEIVKIEYCKITTDDDNNNNDFKFIDFSMVFVIKAIFAKYYENVEIIEKIENLDKSEIIYDETENVDKSEESDCSPILPYQIPHHNNDEKSHFLSHFGLTPQCQQDDLSSIILAKDSRESVHWYDDGLSYVTETTTSSSSSSSLCKTTTTKFLGKYI